MTSVVRWPDEPFDALMRRFKRKVERDNVLREVRRRRYFMPTAEKRRLKATAAHRRRMRQVQAA